MTFGFYDYSIIVSERYETDLLVLASAPDHNQLNILHNPLLKKFEYKSKTQSSDC